MMFKFFRYTLCIITIFLPQIITASDNIKIITTTKPFYNLVYSVTTGVAEPDVLVNEAACPHEHALKPSDIIKMNKADIIIWGGKDSEPFMEKPISQLDKNKLIIDLSTLDGMLILKQRVAHHHHKHSDNTNHDHKHGDDIHHEHDHNHSHAHSHAHSHSHSHDSHSIDPHFWLYPNNAKIIINNVNTRISAFAPKVAPILEQNAKQSISRLEFAVAYIEKQFSSHKMMPFLTFHDAYQYFEKAFDIPSWGTIAINPESPTTAGHMHEVITSIEKNKIACIFSEPGFSPKIIVSLKSKFPRLEYYKLDPIGENKDLGTNGYVELIDKLTQGYLKCSIKKNTYED